jgi:two-component system NtrC family sensor kinase
VEDDGPGIPAELLDRIFDPFFTTKPAGEGCGLGLAISYQIVRKHGGDLAVRSRPGHGTCFTVRLPVQEDPREPALAGAVHAGP